MIYTPEMNDGKHIFVFGSNYAGFHGSGAAAEAHRKWGASYYIGIGRTGMAYALPTKDFKVNTLSLKEIKKEVDSFKVYAKNNPELTFLVTAIGCGLAGYKPGQIAPMFEGSPSNCVLPDEFKSFL